MCFICDYETRYNWIFHLNKKTDVLETFIKFKAKVENKVKKMIIELKIDNCVDFLALKSFLEKNGIHHHWSCPHAHQQIGIVE